MRGRSFAIRVSGAGALLIAAGTLLAQYALDANLQVGGGRVNPASGYAIPLQRDIYRVNRNTGDFMYDNASAFWSPGRYTVAQQQALMREGLMDSWSRPVATTGPDSYMYSLGWRPQNYRYNQANAFTRQQYNVYQSAAPAAPEPKPLEIGQSTPTYVPAGRSSYARPPMPESASIPMGSVPTVPARVPVTSVMRPAAPRGSVTNLEPQVYRPPYVRLPQYSEGG